MRKNHILYRLCLILCIVFFIGCVENNSPNPPTSEQENTDDNSKKSERPVGRPGAKFNDESALKYILGSDEYNMWGVLCRLSSKGREINNSKYTLLCPNNAALLTYGMNVLGLLKKPENIALLDKLVEKHIVPQTLTIERMKVAEELKSLNGEVLRFDVDALTINGVKLNSEQMITKQGVVIGLSGCIDFPLDALSKQLKK